MEWFNIHYVENLQKRKFFLPFIFRIRTEYANSLSTGKWRSEETPYLDTFDVVDM